MSTLRNYSGACFLLRSSLHAEMHRMIPHSLRITAVFQDPLMMVKRSAEMLPEMMAGRQNRIGSLPVRSRRRQDTAAHGMKKTRTISLAVSMGSICTAVSHRISRFPPPIPEPERKPIRIPMSAENGKLVRKAKIEYHPTAAEFRTHGATIWLGYTDENAQHRCRR